MSELPYVLITAVRNEEAVIGETLASMLAQTVPPLEWVIVSDGSTDQTEALVAAAAAQRPWIHLVCLPPRDRPCLAARIVAIKNGISRLRQRDYRLIGALDGDLRFAPDYFAQVLAAFRENPRLGIAGGRVVDVGSPRDRIPRNQLDIPGAVQLFRRECFEAQQGYLPIPEGGSDAIACARARMLGFETRLLSHLVVDHLKPRNVWAGGPVRRKWQKGIRDYALGYHPLFEALKCVSRVGDPPFVLGAFAWWLGYCSATLSRIERIVPPEVVTFIRAEQLSRLGVGRQPLPRTTAVAAK
ncbi:glycosyltransferase [bacterium]|nr:glycosyltransferase [bacterium]